MGNKECEVVINGLKCKAKYVAKGLCSNHRAQKEKGLDFYWPQRFRRKPEVMERDELGNKICLLCKKWLPESEFFWNGYSHDNLEASCKDCTRARSRAWKESHPDQVLDHKMKTFHGILYSEYVELLEAQKSECAICRKKIADRSEGFLDHDHKIHPHHAKHRTCAGCRRGIVCAKCNFMLGNADENAETLLAGIVYLLDWEARATIARLREENEKLTREK